DAPDLESSRVGVGFLDPFVVGAFVVDRDHAEQLLLRGVGAEPVIAALKLGDGVHRDASVARNLVVIRQIERGRTVAFHAALDHGLPPLSAAACSPQPPVSNLPYSSPQPS